jgi:glycerol-3-phosphate O-acyltransferase/dihydroxyacetone phosphate acyltransferase
MEGASALGAAAGEAAARARRGSSISSCSSEPDGWGAARRGGAGWAPVYYCIRLLFAVTARVFYASFDVRGEDNIPKDGEATILCFNHGNSLSDSVVLMTWTPRVVRFTAKNTLWGMPFIGHLIRGSGAVPVFRTREHGDKAAEYNVETFKAVYRALEGGSCVGFSPEGVSSFRSYATKFKDGVGHIALETVERAVARGDDSFCVKVLPAVMVFTHREKFRSDVLVRFRPPVVVDKGWLTKFATRKEAAKHIIALVEHEYHENIISAPDWHIIKYAITATRIHRPQGTYLSLSTYLYLMRGWSKLLELERGAALPAAAQGQPPATVGDLWAALETYQRLIDVAKIKDHRIRRVQEAGGARPSTERCLRIIAYRATLCALLFSLAAPGLLLWSPVWFLIKRKERELLARGIGWVDSVAENKMIVSFFSLITLYLVCAIYTWHPLNPLLPALVALLWLTMRIYEEAVASARSICGIYRLMTIPQARLDALLATREAAARLVLRALPLFPKSSAERVRHECGDDVYEDKSGLFSEQHPRWWTNFNLMRRRKKDWNELLRLSDFCTMDYV